MLIVAMNHQFARCLPGLLRGGQIVQPSKALSERRLAPVL